MRWTGGMSAMRHDGASADLDLTIPAGGSMSVQIGVSSAMQEIGTQSCPRTEHPLRH